VFTVVKFRSNVGANPLISTTLRKHVVVDKQWSPDPNLEQPRHDEFWLVDVVRETSPGLSHGCFIARPVRRVSRSVDGVATPPLIHLLPGTYEIQMLYPAGPVNGAVAVVTPHERDGVDWMLPLDATRLISSIRGTYAVIVNLGGAMWNHVRRRDKDADERRQDRQP